MNDTSRLDPPARVLLTKIGLDGHDRGSRIVAAYLRDAGMEVIYTPPRQTIDAVVKLATEEDVDVIGLSSLATDHLIVPQFLTEMKKAGLDPMDLHAWFEAYVGGRWYTFDATQDAPKGGRVVLAYGRDAADIAFISNYGPLETIAMQVWVELAPPPGPLPPPPRRLG